MFVQRCLIVRIKIDSSLNSHQQHHFPSSAARIIFSAGGEFVSLQTVWISKPHTFVQSRQNEPARSNTTIALLWEAGDEDRAGNQLSQKQQWHEVKTFCAKPTKAEKVSNASLTPVTLFLLEQLKLVEAGGGNTVQECLCDAVYSWAHLVQCGIWRQALRDLPEPCACIKVQATTYLFAEYS